MLPAHDGSASIWGIPVKIRGRCGHYEAAWIRIELVRSQLDEGDSFTVTRLEMWKFFKDQGSALSSFVTLVAVVSAVAIQVGAITETASKAPSKTTVRATR